MDMPVMQYSTRLLKGTSVGRGLLAALLLLLPAWCGTAYAFGILGIPGVYMPQTYLKIGAAYTRAIVPGPSGRPVYVEYNTSGKEAAEIGEATGPLERAKVMPAASYRAYLQRLSDARERYPESQVMKASEYRGKTFKTVTGETIKKPSISMATLTVLVRADEQLFSTDGRDLLLLELPIKSDVQPSSSSQSLLVSEQGDILHQTANTIGYRVGFHGKDGKVNENLGRDRESKIYGPLAGVPIQMWWEAATLTRDDGRYALSYLLPPCPGFTFDYKTDAYLELYYKRFNPRGRNFVPYYIVRPDWDFCFGLEVYSWTVMGIKATMATPAEPNIDFPLDLMVLDGAATLRGAKLGNKTEYSSETGERGHYLQQKYDFDGDEKPDLVVPGKKVKKEVDGKEREVFIKTSLEEAELQGIYLSSRYESVPANTEETAPDFTRLIDTAPDFQDRALLETISEADLRDTDIYVFRESNGQMIAERRGLHESELYKSYSGVDANEGSFRYTIHLRGEKEGLFSIYGIDQGGKNFSKWQSAGGFKEEFQKRNANHLKPGEMVRIIAINRPTGYMGSLRYRLESADASGGFMGFTGQRIEMAPPNLKVWAERKNKIEQGMTKGEEKKQLIGNEGAGLGSDISIAIYTDWLDADGTPLPEELADYGYTGRLAKVVAANQLAPVGANNLSQFEIKPGQHVQVIHLPEKVLAKQHLYLQVAGQPSNRNPDFSSGNGSGILKYRPSKFVPVMVPLHDEEASELARQAYRKADREKPELNLKKPEPMYSWQYRPELQFSLYELSVKEIRTIDAEGQATNIINEKEPQVRGADKYVSVIYDLIKSSFGTLEAWSYQTEREIVLAFGAEEIKATVGESQNIQFENIGQLASLSAEDFLSVRLYANNDAGNILWEFGFNTDLIGQAPQKYISVDNRDVELVSYLPVSTDEEDLKSVKVAWSVTDGGQLQSTVTESKYGIFNNRLTASTKSGKSHIVTAKIIESEDDRVQVGSELKFEPMMVVAGVPASVKVTSESTELLSSGVDKTLVTAKVVDQYNNPVQEGTPVSWDITYSGDLERSDLVVGSDGTAKAVYRAGLETLPTDITLTADDVESKVTIEKKALDYTLSISANTLTPGSVGTVTATLNQAPQSAIDAIWSNSGGAISGPELVEGAVVQAQFRIDDEVSSDGHISVNIGGVTKDVRYTITPVDPEGAMQLEYASIASGAAAAYDVETLQGSVSEAVVQSTNATVYGKPNTTVTISAGGFFTPNQAPIALFPMSGFDVDANGNKVVLDTLGGLEAKSVGEVTWDQSDSYVKPGSSMKFEGGHLLVADNDTLDFNSDYFVNVRFKADGAQGDAVILRKGSNASNGYELRLVAGDGGTFLQARVSTEQGDFTATSSIPVVSGSWYLAGLQLKNGILTVGVDGERVAVAAPGLPNNTGFANNLIIGEGFQGNINEIKIGQLNGSRGSLVLIDGVTEKEITFDQDGKARVSISGGTAKLNNLGARVGFTIYTDPVAATAHTGGRELRYRNAISRLTWLGNTFEQAQAAGVPLAGSQEGGVAVVDGQAMAEAIDMLKKAGKPAWEAIKTATEFLFEMTSISDLYQLTKATYLWINGRFDEVDKIELAFAGIGVTLTVVTIAVSVGSGGTGAPGSIAAMISVKGALKVLKSTLKEIFIKEPGQILKIGGTAARWAFDLVAKILGSKGGAEAAMKQLVDFKDIFVDLIKNGSAATWNLLKSIGQSPAGFVAFLNLRKLRNLPCSVAALDRPSDLLYARLTPLSLAISNANAAALCGVPLQDKVTDLMRGLDAAQQKQLADIVNIATRIDGSQVGGLALSAGTLDNIAEFVGKGRGDSILAFIKNMEDTSITAMGRFRFDNMNKVVNGSTALDSLFDVMKYLPEDNLIKAFNQLAAKNQGNIRGIYGEARTFKELKLNPKIIREDGVVLGVDPGSLKVGDAVDTPLGNGKQGVDIEVDVLVDVSSTATTAAGRKVYVEVKNYTSNYGRDSLQRQTEKHFRSNIFKEFDQDTGTWKVEKPHLHYQWMGDAFDTPAKIKARKEWVIEVCKREIKRFKKSGFDCELDISFSVSSERIDPLTTKGA
ncbi:LamG domain-containing protein [Pseudomonas sp. WS 5013]|uniref:LamG-like jellyroll fold domain-containing protein n=1 Tax=Pseudomonas sp. WS 5013 TaxID=2717475 RepID=UPI001473807A|nr:LamG-like jellyroll fold domain-containing protein [Pseudomonas sp. WS 5013]NMY42812.1 LamG domain-containing protein [Pseudomonas sp. WS 5013]